MKAIATLLLLATLSGCAVERINGSNKWDKGDTIRQGIFLTTLATDAVQSIHMPAEEYVEQNALLGPSPSRQVVVNYNILTALLNTYVAKELPSGFWRQTFQYISIGIEIEAINNNRNERRSK